MGFSLQTALPAFTASSMSSACVLVGVTMTTASTPGAAMASRASVYAWSARASARPASAAAATGSATATTLASAIPARLRMCVWPMRPAPSTATPMGSPPMLMRGSFAATASACPADGAGCRL